MASQAVPRVASQAAAKAASAGGAGHLQPGAIPTQRRQSIRKARAWFSMASQYFGSTAKCIALCMAQGGS